MEIVRVTEKNYAQFSDMLFERANGRPRTEEERRTADRQDRRTQLAQLQYPGCWVYAACEDQRMIGWCTLLFLPKLGRYQGRGSLFVDELWVRPNNRRQGVASALLKKAEQRAQKQGCCDLRLLVAGYNSPAQALYQKCGYRDQAAARYLQKSCVPSPFGTAGASAPPAQL